MYTQFLIIHILSFYLKTLFKELGHYFFVPSQLVLVVKIQPFFKMVRKFVKDGVKNDSHSVFTDSL